VDFGISGRSAIVCGASRGLGKASAAALAQEGVNVFIAARTEATLVEAAEELRESAKGAVTPVVADVTEDSGRDALLAACPEPDILINNAGGPPPGDFRDWRQEDWFSAVNANMFSAIDMIRRTLDGMIGRGFGRIVNVTSVAVKLPQAELGLSNGARAGLTGFVAGIARTPAAHNVTINNLLPGLIATERLQSLMAHRAAEAGVAPEQFIEDYSKRVPAGRIGRPEEFGALCAMLCSQQAAYLTAQNILMDGGMYPGTM
jgi:3-oxoacyl-[acyl-carrier protein] reductase